MPKNTDIDTNLSDKRAWTAADDQALADLRARSIDDSLTETERADALQQFNAMDARRAEHVAAREGDAGGASAAELAASGRVTLGGDGSGRAALRADGTQGDLKQKAADPVIAPGAYTTGESVHERDTRRADGATSVSEAQEADGTRLDQRTNAQRADEYADEHFDRSPANQRDEAELARKRAETREALRSDFTPHAVSDLLPPSEFANLIVDAKRAAQTPQERAALEQLEIAHGEFRRAASKIRRHFSGDLATRLDALTK
jgi:hypothetical protein